MDVVERWDLTWERVEKVPPSGLIDELIASYSELHRVYHNLDHIAECFRQLDACPIQVADPTSLELALWFHDAIYDTKMSDNEMKSAAWARNALRSFSGTQLDRIEQLILVTKHDTAPIDADEGLILDVDLSILGALPVQFDQYEAQIRQEYAWVPDEVYRRDRAKFLTEFQIRPVIYHTTYFRDALEAQARINLERVLSVLTA